MKKLKIYNLILKPGEKGNKYKLWLGDKKAISLNFQKKNCLKISNCISTLPKLQSMDVRKFLEDDSVSKII